MGGFQRIFLVILLIGININFPVKAIISVLPGNEFYTTRNFINAKAETVSVRVNYPYPATEENTYTISPVNPLVEFRDLSKKLERKVYQQKSFLRTMNTILPRQAKMLFYLFMILIIY
jgi:hypothetical protein